MSPAPRSISCHEFVAQLVAAATQARAERSLRTRKQTLATLLVVRYVPKIRVLGLDLRRMIMGQRNRRGADPSVIAPEFASGFSRALTAGGQNGEALRHLAAGAAAVLMRKGYLRVAANALDRAQGVVRGNRAEAGAEVAGNDAGAAAGHLLAAYLQEECTRTSLTRKLRVLLCRPGHPTSRRRSKATATTSPSPRSGRAAIRPTLRRSRRGS